MSSATVTLPAPPSLRAAMTARCGVEPRCSTCKVTAPGDLPMSTLLSHLLQYGLVQPARFFHIPGDPVAFHGSHGLRTSQAVYWSRRESKSIQPSLRFTDLIGS